MRNEKRFVAKDLGLDLEKVKCFDHHLCHAASAYYASSFNKEKALVLTLDGEGDNFCASVNIFNRKKIKVLSRTPREDSLGYIYYDLTRFLGMKGNEHEYKVMGLAPYAKLEYVNKLWEKVDKIVKVDKEKLVFKCIFNTTDTKRYLKKEMIEVRFDVLAGLFQKLVEEKTLEWVKAAVKKTGIKTLVLSGGVFMNVKLNQKIAELPEVKEIFVLPSCADESSVLGSSYLAYIEAIKKNERIEIKSIKDVYWGPEFKDDEVKKVLDSLDKQKYTVKKYSNTETEIAKILANGSIVARLKGKMEFGARALGNRSILADPRNPDIIRVINESVKNRDFWMPFAPSILKERQDDYIVNPKKLDAYYMMMTFDTTTRGREDLKAAMHPYDFTVRPQLVNRNYNPSYHRLIEEFEELTGVGGVLNTSFNIHGYPIVLGPKEAIHTFKNSGIEYLAINNYIIKKI